MSLLGVALPADGIYKVQVRAAASLPNSTGRYMLTVWNATAESASLLVNQQTAGIIETPYSVDRWTFSARQPTGPFRLDQRLAVVDRVQVDRTKRLHRF